MYTLILVLHLLGATVWTGGHLILALGVLPGALRERDPRAILAFESRFERIGIPALVVQVLTGLWLAHRLVPDPALWLSLDGVFPRHVAAKLLLLAATLVLAVDARVRVIPRLTPERLPSLAWHIVAVTVLAVLFVVVGVGFRVGGVL